MGVVRAGSVKMLDPLADNRDPWFQPFFVTRHGRYKSVTRLEMAELHCIGTVWAVAIPRRCAAFGAEEKVGDMAAVAGLLPHLCVALGAYAVGGEAGLRGKGAAAACLAVAAMTHRHAHRIAGAGDAKLAAAAGGAANGFGHRAAFLSATRTSVSSVAPAPSSPFAAATENGRATLKSSHY